MSKHSDARKSSNGSKVLKSKPELQLDDSSDEDESIKSYDIKSNAPIGCTSGDVLSYITQALGIYVLYSPTVQK